VHQCDSVTDDRQTDRPRYGKCVGIGGIACAARAIPPKKGPKCPAEIMPHDYALNKELGENIEACEMQFTEDACASRTRNM